MVNFRPTLLLTRIRQTRLVTSLHHCGLTHLLVVLQRQTCGHGNCRLWMFSGKQQLLKNAKNDRNVVGVLGTKNCRFGGLNSKQYFSALLWYSLSTYYFNLYRPHKMFIKLQIQFLMVQIMWVVKNTHKQTVCGSNRCATYYSCANIRAVTNAIKIRFDLHSYF